MPRPRTLPTDMVTQLTRALHLEDTAGSAEQRRNAYRATSTLMIAAADAGWPVVHIADAMGLRRTTASKRVNDARRRRGNAPAGLVVDPRPRARGPLAELEQPPDDREWLSRSEAAALLGVSDRTIQSLYGTGLLPNARSVTGTWRLYLRADLERVRNGPRRGVYLDRAALREAIARRPLEDSHQRP